MARAAPALALLAVALATLSVGGAQAGRLLSYSDLGWYAAAGGPEIPGIGAPLDGNACCFSAACSVDHSCVVQACTAGGGSTCTQYQCKNCECCPCCGSGEYCYQPSGASGPASGKCCPNGYGGADCKTPICTTPCVHGTCSAPNTCSCQPGWSGPTCATAVCDTPCGEHGSCVGPNQCQCNAGWTGAGCATPICDGGCGTHGGKCTSPDHCTCATGYTGATCDTPICTTPCQHGTCVSPDKCQCQTGWSGPTCNAPSCTPPCSQHGNCTSVNVCTCQAGWTNPTCSQAICSTPCGAHGNCSAPDTCTCASGWSGPNCNTAVCAEGCVNGNCTGPDTCQCNPSWRGPACDTPECQQKCVNGQCVGVDTCKCNPGWAGPVCDECQPAPFTVDDMVTGALHVTDTYLGGCHWHAGTLATAVFSGQVTENITDGRAEWKLFEDGVPEFVASGAKAYFVCTDLGCDQSKPVALNLTDPSDPTSAFTLTVPFTMTKQVKTGKFRLEVIAQDQRTLPYDLQVSLLYNYSSTPSPPPLQRLEGENAPLARPYRRV